MAASLVSIDINELEKQRLGYLGISLTDWTATTVSQYASGSKWECAGSVYELTGNENMGTAGEWAGIGDTTIAYSYFNPATLDFHWTATTAPTWDTAKQGWYGTGGSATYRYIASVYKSSGAYTLKTILTTREYGTMANGMNFGGHAAAADHRIYFAPDKLLMWDNANDRIYSTAKISAARFVPAYGVALSSNLIGNDKTENNIFDALDLSIPTTGNTVLLHGTAAHANGGSDDLYIFSYATRAGANTITLYYMKYTNAHVGSVSSITVTNGTATVAFDHMNLAW